MIKKDGSLVLIDFGAARMRNIDNTKTMTVMFKRGFSPEEQYRYRGKWGPYTDVYSICATMYFMMTGTAPVDSVIRALGDDMPSLISMKELGISMKQRKAIMRGLSVTAKNRWQTMGELCEALYEEGAPQGQTLWETMNKKVAVATAGGVLAVGLTVGIVMGIGSGSEEAESIATRDNATQTVSETAVTGDATLPPSQVAEMAQDVIPTEPPIVKVEVPDTTGKLLSVAKKKLKKKGLTCGVKRVEDSETKGTVIKQSIRGGKRVKEGTKVTLTVSKGLPPTPEPTRAPVVSSSTTTQKKTIQKPKTKKKSNGFAGVIQ